MITPAYNAGLYIAQTIDSVLNQTYPHWEMIVVDDGSTDDTATIVQAYAQRDSRIKYVYQQNGRQGKARNNALSKASGKYIAFLDADDLWMKEKLEVQLANLIQQKVDLIFSDSYIFTDTLHQQQRMNVAPFRYEGMKGIQQFLSGNKIPILTVLATKQSIQECGGFSEIRGIQNAEDYHLWLKMLVMGKTLVAMDPPLTYYREHANAATSGDKEAIFAALHVLTDLAEQYPEVAGAFYGIIPQRIDTFFNNNIIRQFSVIQSLLDIRNQYSRTKVNIPLWRFVHTLFGHKVFRKLFGASKKAYSRLHL